MAGFLYEAFNQGGQQVGGTIDAVDRRSAISELAQKGLLVSEISESSSGGVSRAGSKDLLVTLKSIRLGSGRASDKDVVAMTSQLATALRAGLAMVEALNIIRAQQHRESMKQLLDYLVKAVSSGKALSDAMAEKPAVFSNLFVSMVRVGETGGILDKTMTQLAELLKRDQKVKSNMKSAAIYPVFVLIIGLISVVIVLTKVLPGIIEGIDVGVAVLPIPTRILMGLSDFMISFGWFVLILCVGGGYGFVRWKKTATGRFQWDSFKLKIPILGSVLRTIAVGRFARTLGALTSSGITILQALEVVRDTLGNELLGRKIDEVAARVKMGESLAEPLSGTGEFPPLLIQIISVGEQTGKLDELLLNAADTFDEESDTAINRFMAIFPAILIMLLAVVVGFIIVATLLPILSLDLGGVGI